jgi:hypothetical protein
MKSKAKPAKGSARTKRFDVGGTVGALAGLGTLAYLMSRKKKGADESSDVAARRASGAYRGGAGTDTTTDTTSDTTSDNKPFVRPPPGVIFEEDRAKEKDRMDSAVETHRRITSGGGGGNAPVVKKKKDASAYTGQGMAGSDKGGKKKAGADNAPAYTGQGMAGSDTGAPDKTRAGQGGYQPPTEQHAAEVTSIMKDVKDPNKGKYAGKGKRAVSKAGKLATNAYKDSSGVLYDVEGNPVRQATRKGRDARPGKKAGGAVKKYANGGSVMASKMGSVKTAKPSMRSASSRADGIAIRGKTRA